MQSSLISTSIRYEADGANMAWPIPFPYADKKDVAVTVVEWGGKERRLALGSDYLIDDASHCVMAVVPAGRSVVVWLDADAGRAASAVAARAAAAQARTLNLDVPAAPLAAAAPQAAGVPQAAAVETVVDADLEARLARIEAANDAALVAARAAESDAQVRSIQAAGEQAQTRALDAIDDETQKAIAAVEEKARTALAAALDAQAEAQTALEQIGAEKAALEAYKLELDARASEFSKAVSMAQSQISSIMASEADRAAGSLKNTIRQYAADAGNARATTLEARDATARLADSARQQREAVQSAAHAASADATAASEARQGSDAAANLAMTWARASGYSAAAAHEQALCAGRAAFEAAIAAKQPGIACVRRLQDMVDALPGFYFVDPDIRQSPSQFMGIYAVEKADDMQWDAFFFIDTPWPDTPVMPPENIPPLPPEPDYPNGGVPSANGSGIVWLPCEHEHMR